ncbi:MAG: ABC transporter ATP-binding protein [Patescibacteria group bacterium]
MKPVIEIKNLSKSYDISHQSSNRAGYGTLKDDFENFIKHPLGGGKTKENHETFWALKDVSFEVNKGEIFGVVGQNGSGKSTLLKILSRIVDPTEGSVHMRGRAASLLEVGTGFHPELTGRENIFLNGSMLGMSIQETKKKFNDIVEFSEIEKFLDTPVKFYSSGMYVRLAFSVAAHLEPDILILDEVLAVGDAGFQKKSMNKILATMQEGRTVLIVSHNISILKTLCNRGVLLKNGEIKAFGDIETVASVYAGILPKDKEPAAEDRTGVETDEIIIDSPDDLTTSGSFKASLDFETENDLSECFVNLHIESEAGVMAIHSRTDNNGEKNPSFDKGSHTISVELERLGLIPGDYSMWFRLYSKNGKKSVVVDSPRAEFKVGGIVIDSISPISVPTKWHWDKN